MINVHLRTQRVDKDKFIITGLGDLLIREKDLLFYINNVIEL